MPRPFDGRGEAETCFARASDVGLWARCGLPRILPLHGHSERPVSSRRRKFSKLTSCTCSRTPGAQRTVHRLIDQGALDRMERRIYADPGLMRIRRRTVEHPFRTIKRMSRAVRRCLPSGARSTPAGEAPSESGRRALGLSAPPTRRMHGEGTRSVAGTCEI
jgi:hypothetical protein